MTVGNVRQIRFVARSQRQSEATRVWSGLVWFRQLQFSTRFWSMLVRNISQVKAELSALLESVQSGEDVAIAKAGKPIARLVQFHGAPKVRTPGILDGQR